MSMLEVNIDALLLTITGAAGYEHRIRPITARAASIFAQRLEERCEEVPESVKDSSRRHAPRVNLDLGRMSDEQAAGRIADSWLEALALELR